MPYWLYEYYIDEVIETNKREAKETEDREKEYDNKYKMPNMNSFKMPNMNSFKMPQVQMPKFQDRSGVEKSISLLHFSFIYDWTLEFRHKNKTTEK